MLQKTSNEFKKIFLLEFTKELIKNSTEEITQLQNILDKETQNKRFPKIIRQTTQKILRVPKEIIPKRLQYLKPSSTKNQIDLDKLNPLIKDPQVRSIECNGSDEKIIVKTPQPKTTKIILTEKEIKKIIQTFSKTAKIPLTQGVTKITVGKLILTAITSEIVGSKFIIEKTMYKPIF